VTICPRWITPVGVWFVVAYGFHRVTLRAQNFESDEAIAARASNPKLSRFFRLTPWKFADFMIWGAAVLGVAATQIQRLRGFLSHMGASWPISIAMAVAVLYIVGYYLSYRDPEVPQTLIGRRIVLLIPTCLTLAFAQGFFVQASAIERGAPIEIYLKEQAKPLRGRLIFSLSSRVLVRDKKNSLIAVPWEKIASVTAAERRSGLVVRPPWQQKASSAKPNN
jgi:hypothetical protein